jgi:hypothetical protein
MNHLEGQGRRGQPPGENGHEKALDALRQSKLLVRLESFKERFSRTLPGLSFKTSEIENRKKQAVGVQIELEWEYASLGSTSFYEAKVAIISVVSDKSILFGKGKLRGRSRVTKANWDDTIIEDSLLKLMNSTPSKRFRFDQREPLHSPSKR